MHDFTTAIRCLEGAEKELDRITALLQDPRMVFMPGFSEKQAHYERENISTLLLLLQAKRTDLELKLFLNTLLTSPNKDGLCQFNEDVNEGFLQSGGELFSRVKNTCRQISYQEPWFDTKDLAAETPVFNVPFYPQSPNYDTLTTVVRLTHYGDMMVDTRDHQGRYAWFAIVFFENQEGRFPSDWHSIEPPFPSRVRVKLFRAPGYGDEDRTYGDVAFDPSDDEAGAPLTSSSFCLEEPDIMWHGK
ncbi:hypothetical protein [Candidatus Hepatobacter penaei]|uniref:hypothetical protein n=1 Tax=Candidatus Hepatobacter penaei TaxID=1274402 RepID=UPI0004F2DB5B|nr:hypothetical protein [Candidatus Hepatobacter penaei]